MGKSKRVDKINDKQWKNVNLIDTKERKMNIHCKCAHCTLNHVPENHRYTIISNYIIIHENNKRIRLRIEIGISFYCL